MHPLDCSDQARIQNPKGLHARPCHAFVTLALQFESEILVRCGTVEANGKSILELMTLGAACGQELELRIKGPDATEALASLANLIANGFGE